MTEETQPAALSLGSGGTAGHPSAGGLPEARRRGRFHWVVRVLLYVLAFILVSPLVLTLVYAVVPPPVSNIMLLRALSGVGIDRQWVSLDEISPNLPRAVISSEDARFCQHRGVDWREFQGVIEDALEKDEAPIRGASTIPMQTAKNLFLWDGRFAVRKLVELPLAMWMDFVWSKRRMIEIYLNIVEWAPGVYGAEAAAQHHFGKSAKRLTKREAALLAAVLPNPIKRNAGKPSKGVRRIANRILLRMSGMSPYLACLERPSGL
jgi:monofunctional biosynthetic peptidoglycan transglycosylase